MEIITTQKDTTTPLKLLNLSEDISQVERDINELVDDTRERVIRLTHSSSLDEYKSISNRILKNRQDIQTLLTHYIGLERTIGAPINMKFREWNRRLSKIK